MPLHGLTVGRSATEDTATCFPEPGESFGVSAGSCASLIFFEPPRGLASSGLPPHVVPRVSKGLRLPSRRNRFRLSDAAAGMS